MLSVGCCANTWTEEVKVKHDNETREMIGIFMSRNVEWSLLEIGTL